jgi:hypothetical protein
MPTRRRRAQCPRLGLLGHLLTQRKLRGILFEKSSTHLRAEERAYASHPHGSLEIFLHGCELLQPGQLKYDIYYPTDLDETHGRRQLPRDLLCLNQASQLPRASLLEVIKNGKP